MPTEITSLAEHSELVHYTHGRNIVFAKGAYPNCLYVVVSGIADLVVSGHIIATMCPGEYFGEMSLMDKGPASASIVTSNRATYVKIPYNKLHEFAKEHRNGFTWICMNIARKLSEKLRESNRLFMEGSDT